MNSLYLSLSSKFPQERRSTSTAMKILIFFLSSLSLISNLTTLLQIQITSAEATRDPAPTPWPPQFHSILYQNMTSKGGGLAIIDLWYDWPNGRNLNRIQNQLGKLLYDLEWDNGTSYYYTDLDSNVRECKTIHFEVGILRPNWLDEAEYLGQEEVDGFLCNVWTKVDFIWYYEDVVTKRPVHWLFFTGMSIHVMTFEVGAVLEDEKWQAPLYCFERGNSSSSKEEEEVVMMKGIDHQASSSSDYYGSLMRGWASPSSLSAAAS